MNTEISPLDQIRQTEAEIARKIASAQEEAKQRVAQARKEAKQLVAKARETGHLLGQARGIEIISKSEEESHAIIEQARKMAEVYQAHGQQQMATAVRFVVDLVLGFEGENGIP